MSTKVKIIFSFFSYAVFVASLFLGIQWIGDAQAEFVRNNILLGSLSVPVKNTPEDLQLEAHALLSVEVEGENTRVLLKKNAGKKLPIASLAKLMTALVVLEKYDLSQKITISKSAMEQEGVQGVLKLGQTLSVKNLLYITLIESSNRSAYALAEAMGPHAFVEAMNERAKAMGLTNTNFQDSTGLDSASYSTVADLAKLTQYLFVNYPLFKEIISLEEYDLYLDDGRFHHKLANTNKLLGEARVLGGKTGWTNEAKGCFMLIQDSPIEGSYIIHIILGAEDRFSEMKKLMHESF